MNIIATISGSFNYPLIEHIISDSMIKAVRWNTGAASPNTPYENLVQLEHLARTHEKHLWVDLKCRQLRVKCWCAPQYSEVELNHKIKVQLPAMIQFRGQGWYHIKAVKGNKVYLQNPPKQAIGKGQSVNIMSSGLKIKGYFTPMDIEYILAAKALGLKRFMLSFYEGKQDIEEFTKVFGCINYILGLKIESEKGVNALEEYSEFISSSDPTKETLLIVARDDLMSNFCDQPHKILKITKKCIEINSKSIVASQFFSGLLSDKVNASDFSDICLMQKLGCRTIMLCDEICLYNFDKAMNLISKYSNLQSEI
ncbi:MAG: hypothetical protein ACP5OG_05935 [Candidatus Nanoarchaeia archaeon]